jgi:hypothetical protein
MGCFLIVTKNDFAQFNAAMQSGVYLINESGADKFYIKVVGDGNQSPESLATSISHTFPETQVTGAPHQHHIFPLFGFRSDTYSPTSTDPNDYNHWQNEDFYNFWHKVGINPHDWTVPVDPTHHSKLHTDDWNNIWKSWIMEHYDEVTEKDVYRFASQMLDGFGIGDADQLPYKTYSFK